jgi:hypothetical protein
MKTMHFNITEKESAALFSNGAEAAKNFLKDWDFCEWHKEFRERKV